MYLLGKNSENIFREIQKKQNLKISCQPKKLSSNVSLDYAEVEDIVNRKVDQLSHQYLYQVKLKGEIDLAWLNAHSFVEPLNITKEDLRIVYQESHSLLKNLRKNQKKEEIRWGKRGWDSQSTIPTKIKKKLVNVTQSYNFGPDASPQVEEYGTYKELGLKQQDVTDVLSHYWLSDVYIHVAGILFKKQYPNYPMQLDIH